MTGWVNAPRGGWRWISSPLLAAVRALPPGGSVAIPMPSADDDAFGRRETARQANSAAHKAFGAGRYTVTEHDAHVEVRRLRDDEEKLRQRLASRGPFKPKRAMA